MPQLVIRGSSEKRENLLSRRTGRIRWYWCWWGRQGDWSGRLRMKGRAQAGIRTSFSFQGCKWALGNGAHQNQNGRPGRDHYEGIGGVIGGISGCTPDSRNCRHVDEGSDPNNLCSGEVKVLGVVFDTICTLSLITSRAQSPRPRPSSTSKLQTIQNHALGIVTGCHKKAMLTAYIKVLAVKEHRGMVAKQYLATCFNPNHRQQAD